MDDLIEQLRELNEPVPVSLSLPTFDELVEIEEILLLPLPDDYRTFLMEVSDVVYGTIEPATVADQNAHTFLPDLTAQAWEVGVPREYLVICEDRGDYYCMDQDGKVLRWEAGEFSEEQWDSIWPWAREVWLNS